MKTKYLAFLAAGSISGIVSAIAGRLWPSFLIVGVGVVFAMALLIALWTTGTQRMLKQGFWRIILGTGICVMSFLFALFTLVWIGQYTGATGFVSSRDTVTFGADALVSFFGALMVASVLIAFLALVLTGRWSNGFLMRLIAAGAVAIVATFFVNLPFIHYWSFMGVLLPLGQGLFLWLLGLQIVSNANQK